MKNLFSAYRGGFDVGHTKQIYQIVPPLTCMLENLSPDSRINKFYNM